MLRVLLLTLLLLFPGLGCVTEPTPRPAAAYEVSEGMSGEQVEELLGAPSDVESRPAPGETSGLGLPWDTAPEATAEAWHWSSVNAFAVWMDRSQRVVGVWKVLLR